MIIICISRNPNNSMHFLSSNLHKMSKKTQKTWKNISTRMQSKEYPHEKRKKNYRIFPNQRPARSLNTMAWDLCFHWKMRFYLETCV